MDTIAATDIRQKLKNEISRRVARFADRREDWSVFGFETALDPKFARAQRRYLGASGSVDHGDLRGSIPATAFTMSIQSMPPGNQIPMHCHETEEIFFILDGSARVRCWENGESHDITLGRWDLVALPPFLQHEVFNEGDTICHLQTMLAKPLPLRPHYNDPALLELQAKQG